MSRTVKHPIRSRDGLRQVILFEGVNDKVGLSDLDAVMELRGEFLILFEVKKKGIDIPRGQRKMLETIVDVWQETGRVGIVVKADHVSEKSYILLRTCVVMEIYYKGSWKEVGDITVREFLDNFYKKNNI